MLQCSESVDRLLLLKQLQKSCFHLNIYIVMVLVSNILECYYYLIIKNSEEKNWKNTVFCVFDSKTEQKRVFHFMAQEIM